MSELGEPVPLRPELGAVLRAAVRVNELADVRARLELELELDHPDGPPQVSATFQAAQADAARALAAAVAAALAAGCAPDEVEGLSTAFRLS